MEDFQHLTGQWGIYPHLLLDLETREGTNEKIHPADIEKAREIHASWMVYLVGDVESGYLNLHHREFNFRAKPEGFIVIDTPMCSFGDKILIRRTKGALNEATIFGLTWHTKRAKLYYRVKVAGKLISRWVFEEQILMKLS